MAIGGGEEVIVALAERRVGVGVGEDVIVGLGELPGGVAETVGAAVVPVRTAVAEGVEV